MTPAPDLLLLLLACLGAGFGVGLVAVILRMK